MQDEARLVVYSGGAWETVSPGTVPTLGVNTEADTTNRLAVKSDTILFSHDDVTPGSGDLRLFLNRASAGNIASLLFATNFEARAEIGLVGSDDLDLRVSPDGTAFNTSIRLRAADGKASVPSGFDDPDSVLTSLAFKKAMGTIDNNQIATADFGGPVFGSAILAIPNALTSGPMAFFFARMATSPALERVRLLLSRPES